MDNSKIYSKIIYSNTPNEDLTEWIKGYESGKIFIATEENVDRLWISRFSNVMNAFAIPKVVIPAGEPSKMLDSAIKVWEFLSQNGADRKSLLINIGGGMLTDLAGFAASTFKRGIDFLNIPTTLLSQVDASVGGKTGINFNGLKNEIGTFKDPVAVIIDTEFLNTLDHPNFLSGFAEMIKHGMIKNPDHLEELKSFDLNNISYKNLQSIIQNSVNVKEYFVINDPTEKNIRKALNFGHTAGHAFESLALDQNRPVLHGFAIAWGMIVELFLSVKNCGFDEKYCLELTKWLFNIYGKFEMTGNDFQQLIRLMTHDKKNESGRINFTLLSGPGRVRINQNCNEELIMNALQYYNDLQ
jgi:3-dehydroquinate synthase